MEQLTGKNDPPPGESAGAEIRITTFVSATHLIVEVTDPGEGFDSEKLVLLPITDLRPGGRGILFMKLAMDVVEFDCSRGCLVRMAKRLPPPGSTDATGKIATH